MSESDQTFGARTQRFFADLTGRWVFWALVFALAVSFPVFRSVTREIPPPPPVYGEVPQLDLVDQDGKTFNVSQLQGRVYVANFIFTSCAEVCPRLSTRMRELQQRLANMAGAVHLVSFSVDPERDTPEVLKLYAERFSAREDVWSFVTGDISAMEQTVVDGFKIAMEREEVEDTGFFDIVHGEHFVLVDQLGQIRGYYRADDEGLQQLLNELGLLANLGPRISTERSDVLS